MSDKREPRDLSEEAIERDLQILRSSLPAPRGAELPGPEENFMQTDSTMLVRSAQLLRSLNNRVEEQTTILREIRDLLKMAVSKTSDDKSGDPEADR